MSGRLIRISGSIDRLRNPSGVDSSLDRHDFRREVHGDGRISIDTLHCFRDSAHSVPASHIRHVQFQHFNLLHIWDVAEN
jgi:hypothetical protein